MNEERGKIKCNKKCKKKEIATKEKKKERNFLVRSRPGIVLFSLLSSFNSSEYLLECKKKKKRRRRIKRNTEEKSRKKK
jgi:hypothetical protein